MELAIKKRNAVHRACFLVGGQRALARLLSENGSPVKAQSVSLWCKKGYVPARDGHVKMVSTLTGIALSELNPKVY